MPKMTGFELYNILHQIDDKAKICFTTAYELYYDEFKRMFPEVKAECFFCKPISINNSARVLVDKLQQQDSTKD
jgi:hypothetical protein